MTFTREPGALMVASVARVALFFSGSSTMPSSLEVVADRPANRRLVLANARREDQRIRAVQLQEERADPMPGLVHEDIQRELRAGIALGCLGSGCRGCH